jgi:PAS domain S-box-containing protein
LRESEARLRLAVEAGRMAIWSVDLRTGAVAVTPELNRMVGLPPDAKPTLAELQAQYYPGEVERVRQLAGETLSRGDPFFEAEYRHIRADDGSVRWLLVRAEFQLASEGEPISSIGVVLDITARKEDEERLRLLAREVDHRANNLLAVVQGAIALTRGDTLESYKDALLGRVGALARAHQLLADSRWAGADLRRLVEEELRAYAGEEVGRATIRGEPLELSPALAQGVAMAVHELATNAIKHGAFSVPSGRVCVDWDTPGRAGQVVVTWTEYGGPLVSSPVRRGLGMQVLHRALGGALGGRTEMEWLPHGLTCRLYLSFKACSQGGQQSRTSPATS